MKDIQAVNFNSYKRGQITIYWFCKPIKLLSTSILKQDNSNKNRKKLNTKSFMDN